MPRISESSRSSDSNKISSLAGAVFSGVWAVFSDNCNGVLIKEAEHSTMALQHPAYFAHIHYQTGGRALLAHNQLARSNSGLMTTGSRLIIFFDPSCRTIATNIVPYPHQ